MHYKTLTTLLLASTALAVPTAQPNDGDWDADDLTAVEVLNELQENPPSGVISVLETAIPTKWLSAMNDNPKFRSSAVEDIMSGTYPAWYSTVPYSVKSWATSVALAEYSLEASYASSMPHPTSFSVPCSMTASSSAVASSTALNPSYSSSVSTVTPAATQSAPSSGSTGSSSSSSSSSSASAPSSSSSSTHSTSTFTGGAPAATGGVAMSLAGAAGILGFALAL